jgi:hypothetical protein
MQSSSLDWASHRKRKASVTRHVRLNLQIILRGCIIINIPRIHFSTNARELCSGLQDTEIAVLEKASWASPTWRPLIEMSCIVFAEPRNM